MEEESGGTVMWLVIAGNRYDRGSLLQEHYGCKVNQ